MSFNCSLSNGKISAWASVIVSENEKHQYLKDVPVKDILASVEDGIQGIFPREADLIRGKVVSTIQKKKRRKSVLTKKEHMAVQQLKKDPNI